MSTQTQDFNLTFINSERANLDDGSFNSSAPFMRTNKVQIPFGVNTLYFNDSDLVGYISLYDTNDNHLGYYNSGTYNGFSYLGTFTAPLSIPSNAGYFAISTDSEGSSAWNANNVSFTQFQSLSVSYETPPPNIYLGGPQTVNYLSFDGVNDTVDLGSIHLPQTTIEFWIYFDNSITNTPIIGNRDEGSGNEFAGYFIYGRDDTLRFHVGNGSGFNVINTAFNPNNNLSQWHHVAMTNDGSQLRVYIDGVEDANSPVSSSLSAQSNATMKLGFDLDIGGDARFYFDGRMDEIRFWNYARSQSEIQNNKDITLTENENGLVHYYKFDEGTGTTVIDSAGNNDGTINGATWVEEPKKTPYSIVFIQDGIHLFQDGTFLSNTSWNTTDFIEYKGYLNFNGDSLNNISGIAWYDSNQNYIGWTGVYTGSNQDVQNNQLSTDKTFIPSNAAFFNMSSVEVSTVYQPNSISFTNFQTVSLSYDASPAIDNIYYGIPSVVYTLDGASYDNVSFDLTSQDTVPQSILFNPTGTKLYMTGANGDRIYQYSLSTPYDISTMSYDSVSFSVVSQDDLPSDIAFNNDGTKLYMVAYRNDRVYQYSLSTPYDISTMSYDNVNISVVGQDSIPMDIDFNDDGSKMFILGYANTNIYQYTLSTPFNLATASYDNVSVDIGSQASLPTDFKFLENGSKLFLADRSSNTVYRYSMSSPYDISTLTYENDSFSVLSQENELYCLEFNDTNDKMFIVGREFEDIFQYSMGEQPIYSTIDRVYSGQALVFGTPPPILYQLIADVEVTSNTTQIDFDNLNITKDDELVLTGTFNNIGGNQNYLHIYANNNNTETNYYTQRLYAFGGTIGGSRDNSSYIVRSNASVKNSLKSNIKISNNDRFVVQSNTVLGVGSSGIDIRSANTVSTFSISNLTSISLVADSSSIGAGSRFTLYKINTGSA